MAKKGKSVDILLVKSKVREYIKGLGEYNVSSDFIDRLNIEVVGLIKDAAKRTKMNNRKTLSSKDV